MGSGYAYCRLLFHALLALQFAYGHTAREIRNNIDKYVDDLGKPGDEHLKLFAKEDAIDDEHPSFHMDHMDAALNVFFKVDDLYAGKQMPIYFAIKDPLTIPHLLPREEVDSIPFSSSKLQYLLEFFSFSEDSPQAKAMRDTLGQCELESIKGETKFCATSLESMLDFTGRILGLDAPFKVLTTTITRYPKSNTTLLQNYTVLEEPKQISAPKMVACHTMPYPYAVFYCHGFHGQTTETTENKLFTVSLGGENGDRVDTIAACHMDTSQWDTDHVGFRVLGIKPGSAPVCHFFPADNLVWVPSPSVF